MIRSPRPQGRLLLAAPILAAGLALAAPPATAQAPAPAPAAPTAAANPDRVVARIDGIDITEAEVTIATDDLSDRMQQVPAAQRGATT